MADLKAEGIAGDLLDGLAEIAAFTGLDPARVFVLANRGELPCFRLGRNWHARRSELVEALSARGRPAIKAPIAKRAVEAAN
jgi:hypothetical protein